MMVKMMALLMAGAVLSVPVLRFHEGLARGMRVHDAAMFAVFAK